MDPEIYIELDKRDVIRPIVIAGLPGMGLTGKQSVDFLIEEFHARRVGAIKSIFLSSPVVTTRDGVIEDMVSELFTFYYKEYNGRDFILFTGITQPPSPEWQHNLSRMVIDALAPYKPEVIITLAATPIFTYKWDVLVYGVATRRELVEELRIKGIIPMQGEGYISGVNGLLVGYGKSRGIDGMILMGETYLTNGRDYIAPLAVVRAVSRILDLDLDLSRLERIALAFHKEYSESLKESKKKEGDDSLGYIS